MYRSPLTPLDAPCLCSSHTCQTTLAHLPGTIVDLASSSILVPIPDTSLMAGLRYGAGPRDGARLLVASTEVWEGGVNRVCVCVVFRQSV